ncbi:hypothetical protein PFAG_05351 [Plasmodium falciparum Santa Lucia]|uniref:Uncharacterized protein n=6 Tax=Plasmodium falciparum TaxID=5833 RepID=Q8ILI5_PLAF7|nr:conserved Plasmodium membrane protein, unknown function [Plasmodium falciparum 3D7]ETW34069.1 hypothetical protein PFTANZ_05234 [Plasmodium falciparum Tanzania (2000708)]ETW40010.1 hypothetical protein PFNF135_06036 [Plasmodium falciparum NF135/5.C10]EUR63563.1 hypothetical protein PFBG_05311 [Plasmodium falciparum 7G8]EUT78774.1 hypothetical protein PFAG_05351 [Plasmodium falciparum Santa Lucia]KAF4329353.1 hypothetical protein CYL21_2530 [Plasmodium falciparum NF54]SOS81105.1 conserved P|eukprot:XP_001348432.2 conserved Plasmodium membrane protein, unknown function [Plasmodium falciparum 3D7]
MESLNIPKNVSMDLLEPFITICVIFICLYMIISIESPVYYLIRSFLFKSKIFLHEIKDIFTKINYFALIFSSFFFVSYYILNILNYKNVKSLFCVNFDYYDTILNYNLKYINIQSIFQTAISENYLVNFLYSFKFLFHIFFLNNSNLIKTICTSSLVYLMLSLYAKRVNRIMFISSIFSIIILSGFVIVYFFKKFLNIKYNHCGHEIFSFVFLLFFYIKNPYLSVYQYNDRSLHPYHGTEIRIYIHILFFIFYIINNEKFYEIKLLVAIIIYFIIFLRNTIDSFKMYTFLKVIWLVAYYVTNNYLPFTFSQHFNISTIFNSNIMGILSKEIKNNISLYHFNTISKIPFNYLISKTSFFWIPYMLLNKDNKNFKYVIMLLMVVNIIATCTYLPHNIYPGIPLNLLLLYYLNKIKI